MPADTADTARGWRGLPVILACAVVQGWALYGLHHALTAGHWPATEPALLLGLYAVAVFVPVTLQLLADYTGTAALWVCLAILTVAFFAFGFHDGGFVYSEFSHRSPDNRLGPLLLVLLLLWLQLLPFLQGRLATGRWRCGYPVLFTKAWHNKLALAEAALFTGLFWLLLFLWQTLFGLLGIRFFAELFEAPIFIYPVTALAFGIALHLIGSIERLTLAILGQLLSVLKWLAVVAGFILVIFSMALAVKLPGMLATGERAISAAWLLWLVAVVVLLLNAAYRDGSDPQPYPAWLGRALRIAVPLMLLVSLTALYALVVRTRQYGLTVERVWAFVVAGSALLYSVGYGGAALGRAHWMQGMARVNVLASVALMTVLVLMLTPALSPYRLAADSQFAMALQPAAPAGGEYRYGSYPPVPYLRFAGGGYGLARLKALASLEAHPDAARLRQEATAALGERYEWDPGLAGLKEGLDTLVIYPAGRALEPELRAVIEAHAVKSGGGWLALPGRKPGTGAGLYLDLNSDGAGEFVLLFPGGRQLYARSDNSWRFVGVLGGEGLRDAWPAVTRDLAAGRVSTATPPWNDLLIGDRRLRIHEEEGALD